MRSALCILLLTASMLEGPGLPQPVSECTVAVLSGRVTSDGRPLLWKNRDTAGQIHVLHSVENSPIPYAGIVYPDSPQEFWSGANRAGFAIMNSLPANGVDLLDRGLGNGELMALALGSCVTLADFEALLDSTDAPGRRSLSNFGVIDAQGGAAFYETRNHSWNKQDVAASAKGWAVRSNFSYVGDEVLPHYGIYRHDRAESLIGARLEQQGGLDWHDLLNHIALDHRPEEGLEDGDWIANDETVCRSWTRSSQVIRGTIDSSGEALLFTRLGFPALSAPLPWAPFLGTPPAVSGRWAGGDGLSARVQQRAALVSRQENGRNLVRRAALLPGWSEAFSADLYESWLDHSRLGSALPAEDWFRDWAGMAAEAIAAQEWAGTGAVAEEAPAGFRLLGSWPNPFNSGLRLRWRQESAGPLRLALYDMRGARVRMEDLGSHPAGEHSLRLDTPALPNGSYLLELATPNHRDILRVTHIK